MKIVQIINSMAAGGAEKLAMNLHEEFIQRKHDSHIVTTAGSEAFMNRKGLWCVGASSPYSPCMTGKLVNLIRNKELKSADIIHVHLFPALLRVPSALRKAGWSGGLVASEHSTSNRRRNTVLGKLIDKFTYRSYDRIICVSKAVREELVKWRPELENKTTVIFNGIRLENYHFEDRKKHHSENPIIISIGRLTCAKNYYRAIQAVALLKNRLSEHFKYLIAGDGPEYAKMNTLIKELNMDGIVKLLGRRENIPELLSQGDIFFIPSLWEGFGIAAVEAMASGLPVVASNVPGVRDVVGDEAGIFIDPESIDEMANALEKLLNDKNLASRLGSGGLNNAGNFSLEKCADNHLRIYNSLIEQKPQFSLKS